MSEFRTFSGKTVDEAMEAACRQLGSPREKLEIEILSGGSSGIFGLVGKKKAQIKARIREEINLLTDMHVAAPKSSGRGERASRPSQAAPKKAAAAKPSEVTRNEGNDPEPAEVAATPEPQPEPETAQADLVAPSLESVAESVVAPQESVAEAEPEMTVETVEEDETSEDVPDVQPAPREACPREERKAQPAETTPPAPLTPELEAIVREAMDAMLDGILGQIPPYEVSGDVERIAVLVRDEENSGLLIGREGQTLSAIQYLVNRIVIRRYGNPVKVQLNTGEYRERQDDNLRKMAIFLADKAKSLGRPQSTKPLSSYHRRVVHLALQEDEAVSTRSKGEGPLKRVLILPRTRGGESHSNGQRS